MSLISGAGAVAGLVGAYMGHQAQQEAQSTREAQVSLLKDQLAVARDNKEKYTEAVTAMEQALERFNNGEPGKGTRIDEKA